MARYRDAINWIATNDEPSDMDIGTVSELISVLLIADIWRKSPEDVAMDVISRRATIQYNDIASPITIRTHD